MPTVVEVDGYRVMVYTRDEHPPAHVHVQKAENKIKIILGEAEVEYHSCQGTPTRREIQRAQEVVTEHLDQCWATWKVYNP